MTAWHAGQQVALDRTRIMVIDRVTPTGRAFIGTREFNPDGSERGGVPALSWRTSSNLIEPLTPELAEAIALMQRWALAKDLAHIAVHDLTFWTRANCAPHIRVTPDVLIIEHVERMTAAINSVLPKVPQ